MLLTLWRTTPPSVDGHYDARMTDGTTSRVPEVVAALTAVIGVIFLELILFEPERVREEAADVVTLCAFGGLGAAVFKARLHSVWASDEAASAVVGFSAGLAVLHATRMDAISGFWIHWLGITKWTLGISAILAALTVVAVFVIAEIAQKIITALDSSRLRVSVGLVADGLVVLTVAAIVVLVQAVWVQFQSVWSNSTLTRSVAVALVFTFAALGIVAVASRLAYVVLNTLFDPRRRPLRGS